MYVKEFDGLGRGELEVLAASLRRQLGEVERTVTICQERATELVLENRSLKSLIRESFMLPGWICPSCLAFNGEAKEVLAVCRCCGTKRRSSTDLVEGG